MSETVESGSLERKDQLGKSPQAIAKKWKLELKLADKRELDWRKKARGIYQTYTPDKPATNSFNILWSNTETLRQAVYNSLPQPNVGRRYESEDPVGKAVSEVLGRALEFSQDTYDFDQVLKSDVLCMLLAGRAISRVRYVPDIKQVGEAAPEASEEATSDVDEEGEAPELDDAQESEAYEEIAWEQVICENVAYDDFRILCAAKTWAEVTAIAFRHRFTREDCVEKFGEEIGNKIPLDAADDEDVKKSKEVEDLFKTAEVWEIWDKDEKKVLFICPTYPEPCKVQDDPMKLQGFFPIPRPLYAIENDTTLVPAPLYTQYEQQAKELNKVSGRINKLVDALKVRGIYDSTITELNSLMEQPDNKLIAAENVTALIERGGLEKAIWMLPIDTLAVVLKELYIQRDQAKQVIYEITGISDIMRSASDPNETFGAQKIKTKWGTQRLQRMQMDVQRYIRDLIRLKAEIIAEKFQMSTLEQMTLVKLPHQQEVDQKNQEAMFEYRQTMQKWGMAAQQAQAQGQPVPQKPEPFKPADPVTWEKVMEAMQNDATRTYRIDIETDSTIAATQDADFDGLNQVITAVTTIMEKFMPLVQMGDMDIEVLKELMLVPCRRARMGSAVEDAINKMHQPAPKGDPEQAKMQAQQQLEQIKAQTTMQLEQMKAQLADQQNQRQLAADAQAAAQQAQLDAQLQAHEQQVQAQQNEHQNQLEAQRAQQQAQMDAQLEAQRMQSEERLAAVENQTKLLLAQLQRQTAIEVAEIGAQTTLESAQISAAKSGSE